MRLQSRSVLHCRPVVASRLHSWLLKAPSCKLSRPRPPAASARCLLPLIQPGWRDPCWQRYRAALSLHQERSGKHYPTRGVKVSLKAFLLACSEMKIETITHGKDQYPDSSYRSVLLWKSFCLQKKNPFPSLAVPGASHLPFHGLKDLIYKKKIRLN